MNEKMVSVIVPVYNCEKYLKRCLDSLMAQTLREIEFVLIDNGSTDQSGKILHEYQEKDQRFSVITQENRGICGSRNRGLAAVQGTYIGFVDADDYVEPEMFQTMLDRISETKSDVAICDYAMTYLQREIYGILKLKDSFIDVTSLGQELFYLRYFGKNPEVWNKLYHRSLIVENNVLFETGHGEDLLFQLRLMPHIRRLCTVSSTLYHYRQRKSSAAHCLDRVSQNNITILQKYLDESMWKHTSERIAELAFSTIFTGFLFSTHCTGQRIGYFYENVKKFRHWNQFDHFCDTISKTNELQILHQEGVLSIRFYWFQKILFSLCSHRADHAAALLLWVVSKLIVFKKRRFLTGWYE